MNVRMLGVIEMKFIYELIFIIIAMVSMLFFTVDEYNQCEVIESEPVIEEDIQLVTEIIEEPIIEIQEEFVFSKNLSEEDKYLLAKIAMAEAEGESFETKVLIIETVLNRVESKRFPNTVKEVIFEEHNGTYQFSPVMPDGRWWKVEPNKECWEAVNTVNNTEYDISEGALFFEACKSESWHSRNLQFIRKSDNTSFYK